MRTTAPGQSALLLLDIINILNKRQIPYAIIGAFAASYYGIVRASLDADAMISVHNSQDIANLCIDFTAMGLKIEHRKGDQNDPIAAVLNLQDQFSNRVDLLMGIRGVTEEVFTRVQEAKFMDSSIKMVGLEDFIALKIFAGSPKDMDDVMGVFKISGHKINLELLRKLVSPYGTDCTERLEKILKDSS